MVKKDKKEKVNSKVTVPEQNITANVTTQDTTKKDNFVASDLIGLTIKVNYNEGLVFFDSLNGIYIGINEKPELNVFKITKEPDLKNIIDALKSGKIFIFDEDKDVSAKFGGVYKTKSVKKNNVPLVIDNFKVPTDADKAFIEILKKDIDKAIESVLNITSQETLKRLYELELNGFNRVQHGRIRVLDEIKKRIKE